MLHPFQVRGGDHEDAGHLGLPARCDGRRGRPGCDCGRGERNLASGGAWTRGRNDDHRLSRTARHRRARRETLDRADGRRHPVAARRPTYNALLALLPGLVTNVTDPVAGPSSTAFPLHGGRQNEGRLTLDGLTIGSPPSGNSAASYDVDVARAQEVTFTISGGLGESETAGLVVNIVPNAGGGTTHGSVFASGSGRAFQSNNLTSSQIEQGAIAAAAVCEALRSLGDARRFDRPADRLWYFFAAHKGSSTRNSTNDATTNANAGDADEWRYVPDLSRPALFRQDVRKRQRPRLTWRPAERHKLSGFWDAQALCRSMYGRNARPLRTPARLPKPLACSGGGSTSPRRPGPRHSRIVCCWKPATAARSSAPATSSAIPIPRGNLVRVVEQCASGCAANGNIPGAERIDRRISAWPTPARFHGRDRRPTSRARTR